MPLWHHRTVAVSPASSALGSGVRQRRRVASVLVWPFTLLSAFKPLEGNTHEIEEQVAALSCANLFWVFS